VTAEELALRQQTAEIEAKKLEARNTFSLLRTGTFGAVVLVALCLVGAGLLCFRLIWSSLDGTKDELMVRVLLSCIACFMGMGFACLGFGLFLIQAKGTFSADGQTANGAAKGQLATNAPGLVVVVCATIVIALALNLSWRRTTGAGGDATGPGFEMPGSRPVPKAGSGAKP